MIKIIVQNLFFSKIIFISLVLAGLLSAETPSIESGFIAVDGGKIFYEAAGKGPALIMIHDGILHRETWDAQFTEFANTHRVIRWDRRGYGRSPKPEASFTHLDDLLTLMDSLKVDKAVLMGCSSGGLLAIDFALEHPERVQALVLAGPIISGFGFSRHFRTRGGWDKSKTGGRYENRIDYWSQIDPWVINRENKAAGEKLVKLLNKNPQNIEGSGRFARSPGRPAIGLLPKIKIPTLIIAGESDLPDVHAHVGVIQAGIAGSERVVLADSGHLAHFEVPDEFNKVVRDFFESFK